MNLMKNYLLSLLAVMAMLSGCSGLFDSSDVDERLQSLENRMDVLETMCNDLNSEIMSIHTLLSAIKIGDYITSVTPLIDNGVEVGYTISFLHSKSIVVYHGKQGPQGEPGKDGEDGKDGNGSGAAPKIGVRKDVDGFWYWTLDGEWMLDDSGNKVKAAGTDGKDGKDGKDGADGVTPELKIEDGYWYVSYNDGADWTRLGKAVGEDGAPGSGSGDSMFKSVTQDSEYVYFTLQDGTVLTLQKKAGAGLDIVFSVEQGVAIVPGSSIKIKYEINGGDDQTLVRLIHSEYESCVAGVKPSSPYEGYIYVYMEGDLDDEDDGSWRDEPYWEEIMGDLTEGEVWDGSMAILISVSDGKGNNILKALNIVEGKLDSTTDAYLADSGAGSVKATVETNVDYDVVVPEKAESWLAYSPTKATMRQDVLEFSVTANEGKLFRSALVNLNNAMGQTLEKFTIVQRSSIANEFVTFADPKVETACVTRFDTDNDGRLTYEEVAMVTDVTDLFRTLKTITSFDEFEYFTSVTSIPDEFFLDCSKLESVKLPSNISTIGHRAFAGCVSLKSIVIPEGVLYDDYYDDNYGNIGWFSGCVNLVDVTIPSSMKNLPNGMFENCTSLKHISIPAGVTIIPGDCFYRCKSLATVECAAAITEIHEAAFCGCRLLTQMDLSEVKYLGGSAFARSGLKSIIIPSAVTEIPSALCAGCEDLVTVTLHDKVIEIRDNAFGYVHEYDDYYRGEIGCSSLKHIDFPESLRKIWRDAFAYSALEGELIEGTDIKALVIPKNIERIWDNAFEGCTFKAVKMSSSHVPSTGLAPFSDDVWVYVPADAVDSFRSQWYEYEYTILPYEMMNVSLGLDCKLVGCSLLNYESGGRLDPYALQLSCDFDIKISGNTDKLTDVSQVGMYIHSPGTYGDSIVSYYPVAGLNVPARVTAEMNLSELEATQSGYSAVSSFEVGAYILFADGTRVNYPSQPMTAQIEFTE